MYKGHKISKRLERYIGYAKTKYDKSCVQGQIDIWEILNEYDLIKSEAYCVQMYIYDLVKGECIYKGDYQIVKWVNGGIYVREVAVYCKNFFDSSAIEIFTLAMS